MPEGGPQVTYDHRIPFSRPFASQHELRNLQAVLESDHAHGDGVFTRSASDRLRSLTGVGNVLLTTSCTHALEMACQLLDLGDDDEVIVPSFTFSSAANAVARTGARCVFVGIEPTTGNIDPGQVEEAVGPKTRAVIVMHYGGVPVDMASIMSIADRAGIRVIEDNAHGLGVDTGHGILGGIGALGTQSFHDTKNVHCGEGGALLINDSLLMARAEVIREKGTNRAQFLRGAIDKYSWIDLGSSYLPSEFNAAVLDSQLESFDEIQTRRFSVWNRYARGLEQWAEDRGVMLMRPAGGIHAAHVFYLLMPDWSSQGELLDHLHHLGIMATFHYVPLGSSPAGTRFGRVLRPLAVAEDFSRRIVRLPLWAGMSDDQVARVIDGVLSFRASADRVATVGRMTADA